MPNAGILRGRRQEGDYGSERRGESVPPPIGLTFIAQLRPNRVGREVSASRYNAAGGEEEWDLLCCWVPAHPRTSRYIGGD